MTALLTTMQTTHSATGRYLMRLVNLKHVLIVTGTALVFYGYWLLAVPPDALYQEMLSRAKGGILSVVGGCGLLMAWMTQR